MKNYISRPAPIFLVNAEQNKIEEVCWRRCGTELEKKQNQSK